MNNALGFSQYEQAICRRMKEDPSLNSLDESEILIEIHAWDRALDSGRVRGDRAAAARDILAALNGELRLRRTVQKERRETAHSLDAVQSEPSLLQPLRQLLSKVLR